MNFYTTFTGEDDETLDIRQYSYSLDVANQSGAETNVDRPRADDHKIAYIQPYRKGTL